MTLKTAKVRDRWVAVRPADSLHFGGAFCFLIRSITMTVAELRDILDGCEDDDIVVLLVNPDVPTRILEANYARRRLYVEDERGGCGQTYRLDREVAGLPDPLYDPWPEDHAGVWMGDPSKLVECVVIM
jgi:hypothetical protein